MGMGRPSAFRVSFSSSVRLTWRLHMKCYVCMCVMGVYVCMCVGVYVCMCGKEEAINNLKMV